MLGRESGLKQHIPRRAESESTWESQSTVGSEHSALLMIVASDGIVEGISADRDATQKFAIGTSIFKYVDESSAQALMAAMSTAAEQGRPERCKSVSTYETVFYSVEVASFSRANTQDRKYAMSWQHAVDVDKDLEPLAYAPRPLRADASEIIHDLNNLLTTVITFAGFLTEDLEAGDSRRQDACEVLEAASQAGRLAGELLAIDLAEDE